MENNRGNEDFLVKLFFSSVYGGSEYMSVELCSIQR